jgi:NAD(P)-dependent dehydrogenase (short-subunit alcohol dehydrogenase family)
MDKVLVITGGSRGIGLSTIEIFVADADLDQIAH